jgi:ribosomal protein S18 acetylase RimI-like enzyme
MTIRPATAEDTNDAIALWQQCDLTRPWNDPASDFARAIGNSGSEVLVMRDQGRIVGSVMVGHDGHRGWVYYLAVAPDARGQGLGRTLMDAAEAWLGERGVPKVQLMVRDTNAAAQAFYTALGYAVQPVATWGKWIDK